MKAGLLVLALMVAVVPVAHAHGGARNGAASGPIVIRPSAPRVPQSPVTPHAVPHLDARPQHPSTPASHSSNDLFLAKPWTYRPHDRGTSGRHSNHGFEHVGDSWHWPGGGWPYLGPLYEPYPEDEEVASRDERPAPTQPGPLAQPLTTVSPVAVAPAPPPPSIPAPHKTFYVIPLCYAGDVPPTAETGCDLTKLRTIR